MFDHRSFLVETELLVLRSTAGEHGASMRAGDCFPPTLFIMGIFSKRSVADLGEKKKDMPEGLWVKCPSCGESLYEQALAKNLRVCTHCAHHFTLNSEERIAALVDEGSFEEIDADLDSVDALGFKDYLGKVKAYQAKTGLMEAVITGRGRIDGTQVVLAIMDFRFLGASMGS